MSDFADVITVLVIAGMIGFRFVNVNLQIRFHLAVIQIAFANIVLVSHIGNGNVGRLDARYHRHAGSQASGEHHDNHSKKRDGRKQAFPRHNLLRHGTDNLPAGVQDVLRMLFGLFRLTRRRRVFALDFLFLRPFRKGAFPFQFGMLL